MRAPQFKIANLKNQIKICLENSEFLKEKIQKLDREN
jgi:hypothetical protein